MPTQPDSVSIAFICAMPMELRPLARRLSLRASRTGAGSVYTGTLGGRAVLATVTGMGTSLAAAGTRRLLDAVAVGHVVVVGITGAVDDSTPIGTVIRPELVVDGATGAEHVPAPLGEDARHGTLWTTDELITDSGVLAGLRARGVVALDMETAAVAGVCESLGIGWSVVRVISDRATDGTVTEEVFRLSNQDGTPNFAAVARYVLAHPGRIRLLARLASGARLATQTAAEAAISACAVERS